MKCQRNASPNACVLRDQLLSAILPHDLDPGGGKDGHVLEGDIFGGSDDRHRRTGLLLDCGVGGADRVGVHGRSFAARASNHSRALRQGSSTTASSSCLST